MFSFVQVISASLLKTNSKKTTDSLFTARNHKLKHQIVAYKGLEPTRLVILFKTRLSDYSSIKTIVD